MNRFQESELLRKSINAIMDHASMLDRGDVITYHDMTRLSGFTRDGDHWRALCVKLLKTMVDQRGIALLAVENLGYRLMTHQEQLVENPLRRLRKAQRQVRRAVRETSSIPDRELTQHLRIQKHAKVQFLRQQRRAALRAVRVADVIEKPADVPPRKARKSFREEAAAALQE